jgi:UDP-glucose 4-epimerase
MIKILEFLVCLVDETIIDEKKLQDAFNYMDSKKQKNICADGLFKVFSIYKFDLVIHLAGRIEAGISFKEPTEFYSVNTGGTCNLINQMDLWQVKNIIFSFQIIILELIFQYINLLCNFSNFLIKLIY